MVSAKIRIFRTDLRFSMFSDIGSLQQLPITCDLSPSKESNEVAFWWTSIKEKPLELFLILTIFQGSRTKSLKVLYADS